EDVTDAEDEDESDDDAETAQADGEESEQTDGAHADGAESEPTDGAHADQADGADADASSNASGEQADDGDDATPDASDVPPLRTILEAVLFATAEPLPLTRLVRVLGAWPRAAVSEALDELRASLENDQRGIRLIETAG